MSISKLKYLQFFTGLLLILAIAVSPYIADIQYRSDIVDYFHPADHRVKAFNNLQKNFGSQQTLIVFIAFQQNSFLTEQRINSLYELSSAFDEIEAITQTKSILNTPVSNRYGDTLSVEKYLKQQLPLNDHFKGQLADNAQQFSSLVSPDQGVVSFQLFFRDEIDRTDFASIYHDINQALSGFSQRQPESQHYFYGPMEIKQALHEALLHDAVYLMPLVLVCGLFILGYFLRSSWLVFAGIASIVVALWLTLGLVGVFKLTLNQTSALAIGIAFIIALADIIHLLMSYVNEPRDLDSKTALTNSLSHNLPSLFLTSLTTSIGFLSLNFSSSPVFATFGNIAAIGVCCAFITAVTVTPVLVLFKKTRAIKSSQQALLTFVKAANEKRVGLQPIQTLGFYGLCYLLMCGLLLITYHNDPLEYFHNESNIHSANQLSQTEFNSHHPVTIRLDTGRDDGLFKSQFLQTLNSFQDWLTAHPLVSNQQCFLDMLTPLNRHLHQNNLKWQSPASNERTLADLWNIYEMASPDNTPASLGIDDEFRSATLTVTTPYLRSSQLLALEKQIYQWFKLQHPEILVEVSGHSVLFASIGKDLTRNMLLGGLFSALVISILIGFFVGNLKAGLLSLIPNLIPAAIVYGIWGYSVGIIDIAAAGTLTISLGIVVDDTIHILKRYLHFRARYGEQGFHGTLAAEKAISKTLEQVGAALILTTVIISLGLGILTLSIFGPNQTTAILLSSIILIALIFDFVMLPQILKYFDSWLFPHSQLSTLSLKNQFGSVNQGD